MKYIGYTSDLKRRLNEHLTSKGAKFARNGDWRLVYYEAYSSKKDAMTRENKLKKDGRTKYHLIRRIEDSLTDQN